jgi:hypothetical protein
MCGYRKDKKNAKGVKITNTSQRCHGARGVEDPEAGGSLSKMA